MAIDHSRISPIDPAEVDQSFVLAQLAAPDLDRETWRRLCAGMEIPGSQPFPPAMPPVGGEPRQIWVARDRNGYLRALCVFRPVSRTFSGLTLDVEMLVVASTANPKGAVQDIIAALQMLALRWNCSSVRITTGADDTQLRRYLAPFSESADHILSVPIPKLAS